MIRYLKYFFFVCATLILELSYLQADHKHENPILFPFYFSNYLYKSIEASKKEDIGMYLQMDFNSLSPSVKQEKQKRQKKQEKQAQNQAQGLQEKERAKKLFKKGLFWQKYHRRARACHGELIRDKIPFFCYEILSHLLQNRFFLNISKIFCYYGKN